MAEEHRAKQSSQMHAPKPNITKEEAKTIKELKQDKDSHTYCGVALVVVTDWNTSENPWTFWEIGTPTEL